jgi:hypothetical protein
MDRQPGTKDSNNTTYTGIGRAFGRGVGFIVLSGLAMVIIAAIVLMPAWASTIRAEYERDTKHANIEHSRKIVATGARLNDAIPHDRVINERLVKGTVRQDLIHAPAVAYPPEPSGWMLGLADKLARPKTRRGLFFVACVALAGAMFLFAPPIVKRASRSRQET